MDSPADSIWRSLTQDGVSKTGRTLSYVCETDSLGAVLPSNSPGVHSLWVPAIPLKVPACLETRTRGTVDAVSHRTSVHRRRCSRRGVQFLPDRLRRCQRNPRPMRTRHAFRWRFNRPPPWVNTPRVEIHGPGRSKIIIHEEEQNNWEQHLDLIVESVAKNGGRSCINASGRMGNGIRTRNRRGIG